MRITFSLLVLTLCILTINVGVAGSADIIKIAGDAGAVVVPAVAGIMTLIYHDSEGTVQFLKAYASAAAMTYGLKYAVKERRPDGSEHSFPSFHTSSAFAGAAFIQQRDGWKYGLPAYIAASFVGYSRLESKQHHIQDVIGAAVIGIGTNLIFVKPFKSVTVTPVVGEDFNGILIGKSF
jgi:membrane-associated phospholipid phosphatase